MFKWFTWTQAEYDCYEEWLRYFDCKHFGARVTAKRNAKAGKWPIWDKI